jgi:hypothetical protein
MRTYIIILIFIKMNEIIERIQYKLLKNGLSKILLFLEKNEFHNNKKLENKSTNILLRFP